MSVEPSDAAWAAQWGSKPPDRDAGIALSHIPTVVAKGVRGIPKARPAPLPPAPLDDFARSHLRKALKLKGQWTAMLWERRLKTLKGVESIITKQTSCMARIGVDYENKASTIEGRASGELPATNQGLPWGQWARFPYLIKHKGGLYLRVIPRAGKPLKTIYRINGQICRREEVESLCLASEFRDEEPGCLTIKAANLRRIRGGETI